MYWGLCVVLWMKDNLVVGDGHLSDLYLRWKNDPKKWEAEMLETIDKIISATVGSQFRKSMNYRPFECDADLRQELRVVCFEKVLPRIKYTAAPGTCMVQLNKRLYNYLKMSIINHLKDFRDRTSLRRRRDDSVFSHQRGQISKRKDSTPLEFALSVFEDSTKEVAQLLAGGEKKKGICRKLQMKPSEYDRHLKILQKHYKELGYGNE